MTIVISFLSPIIILSELIALSVIQVSIFYPMHSYTSEINCYLSSPTMSMNSVIRERIVKALALFTILSLNFMLKTASFPPALYQSTCFSYTPSTKSPHSI